MVSNKKQCDTSTLFINKKTVNDNTERESGMQRNINVL